MNKSKIVEYVKGINLSAYEILKNKLHIEIEVLVIFFRFFSNIGFIFSAENSCKLFFYSTININSKQILFGKIDTKLKVSCADFRDLCIKKNEIAYNIKLNLIKYFQRHSILKNISNSSIFHLNTNKQILMYKKVSKKKKSFVVFSFLKFKYSLFFFQVKFIFFKIFDIILNKKNHFFYSNDYKNTMEIHIQHNFFKTIGFYVNFLLFKFNKIKDTVEFLTNVLA